MHVRWFLFHMVMAFLICSSAGTAMSPIVPGDYDTDAVPAGIVCLPGASNHEQGTWYDDLPHVPVADMPVVPLQPDIVPATGMWPLEPVIFVPTASPGEPWTLPNPAILSPPRADYELPTQTFPVEPSGLLDGATGTIRWIDLEAGFFGIECDDGTHYLPLNIGGAFRVDGMRVMFTGYLVTGTTAIQMWGTPITLLSIEPVDDGSAVIVLKYRRSGGIAGFQDELIVYGDGTAVITRRGHSQVIQLTSSELDSLVLAAEGAGFPELSHEYLPEEGACDLFFYEVTWKGTTVYSADTVVPSSLVPLFERLDRIVTRLPPW